nr:type II toxin-antitoxin system YafQ family toxin [uncultured Campylobacter sp.]
MKYEIKLSKTCKKNLKKLSAEQKLHFLSVIEKLANNEKLEKKYQDHALKGDLVGYRDCHLEPDLILVYKKINDELIIYCLNIGSHAKIKLK